MRADAPGHGWHLTRQGDAVDIRITDNAGTDVLVTADLDEAWRLALGLLAVLRGVQPCPKCFGDKLIADSEDGEPWSAWANLPPGSDLAVRLGVVKPIACPECNGTGTKP